MTIIKVSHDILWTDGKNMLCTSFSVSAYIWANPARTPNFGVKFVFHILNHDFCQKLLRITEKWV